MQLIKPYEEEAGREAACLVISSPHESVHFLCDLFPQWCFKSLLIALYLSHPTVKLKY